MSNKKRTFLTFCTKYEEQSHENGIFYKSTKGISKCNACISFSFPNLAVIIIKKNQVGTK